MKLADLCYKHMKQLIYGFGLRVKLLNNDSLQERMRAVYKN